MAPLPTVHPLQPRFAQAITGVLSLEAIVFGQWPALAVALALVLLSLAGPRWSPVGWVFRRIAPPAQELEPAAPVRFSQVLAAIFLAVALILIATGLGLAGWILAGLLAAVALLSSITGFCVGCEAYRLLLAARRGGEDDVRGALGLTGGGPWLVVLEAAAGEREVVRVNLAEHPAAAALPVRSVPAALAVGSDGRLRAARAGRLDEPDLDRVLAAL
jgi:uncharacterized protein DUF4395